MDTFTEAQEYASTSDDDSFASITGTDDEDTRDATASDTADYLQQLHISALDQSDQANSAAPQAELSHACMPLAADADSAAASTDGSAEHTGFAEASVGAVDPGDDADSMSAASEPALTPEQYQARDAPESLHGPQCYHMHLAHASECVMYQMRIHQLLLHVGSAAM